MRDNPIHSVYQVMIGQIHDHLALGSSRWFTVAMAWAMFRGGRAVAASLAMGFAVRFTGTRAALFILHLLGRLYNDPTKWVWTYVGIICAHGMFAADGARRSLAMDYLLRTRPVLAPGSRLARFHAQLS